MKTLDIELALMAYFNYRANVIVPNVHWGMDPGLHECDILVLTPSGYATEVEIKVNKTDLRKDVDKNHNHDHPLIRRTFFAVPDKLVETAVMELDPRFGVLSVTERWNRLYVTEIRPAKINPKTVKWTSDQRMKLMRLGCLRIHTLKQKLWRLGRK